MLHLIYLKLNISENIYCVKHSCSGCAPSTAKPDVVGELERLGKLRETGVISEDEFQSMKAKLLFS
ncbi:SHOCT domain-containing protein [bacterium]|nr:SHOCT domain-containing protein [bacterium]MBP9810734.1 SHOCT domain-containing protein [bacterium]